MSLFFARSPASSSWFGFAALLVASACGTASDGTLDGSANTPDGGSGGGTAGTGGAGGGSIGGSGGAGGSGGVAGSGGAAGMAGSGGTLGGFTAIPTTYAIHASHELFAFRLCVEANGEVLTKYPYPFDSDHHLPETNFPGIAVGGQVDLEPLLNELGPISTITLHAVRAENASVVRATPAIDKVDCSKLLYGFEKLPAEDFVTFENVELGDEIDTPIRVLIVDGCRADASLTTEQCGASFDPTTGNLRARVMGFNPYLAMEPSTTMVYPMHVSPSLAELAPEHTLEMSYENLTSGAGSVSISNDVPEDDPSMTAGAMTPPATMEEYGEMGFKVIAKSASEDKVVMEASLANTQRVSSPYDTPEAFFIGANGLLVVFVGDASDQSETWLNVDGSWNPMYDGRGLHPLTIPFNFTYRP